MPDRCCVVFGCKSNKKKDRDKSFYRFPGKDYERDRKRKWIDFVRNGLPEKEREWWPTDSSRICCDHFIGSSKSSTENHPSYLPTIYALNIPEENYNGAQAVENYKMEKLDVQYKTKENETKIEQINDNENELQPIEFVKVETTIDTLDSFYEEDTKTSEESDNNQCELCEKVYNDSDKLKKHMLIHKYNKLYECEVCKKRILGKSHLVEHVRTHSNERPYQCEICEKSFITKSDVTRHKRTHTHERPYKCTLCEKAFMCSGSLTRHMCIHTNERRFKCGFCDKAFKSKEHLTVHIRIHTGEKPFICDVCDRGFSEKGSLDKHSRIHTKEKPYTCEICGKAFGQRESLKRHVRSQKHEMKLLIKKKN